MPTRKRPHDGMRDLCAHAHEDDGLDPREWSKPTHDTQHAAKVRRRKDLQLCKQARMAIDRALAGSINPLLRELHVHRVEPAPDARRLNIHIAAPGWILDEYEDEVLMHLRDARGYLRCEVAAAMSRKAVPQLVLHLIPTQEVNDAPQE